MKIDTAPLSDTIITALSRLIDDSQVEKREPSHSDLTFIISRVELTKVDPKFQGQIVGKAKRVRAILSWALENNPAKGVINRYDLWIWWVSLPIQQLCW